MFSLICKIRKIYNRGVVKNIAVLTIGTGIAQFLSLVFSPLIARVYGPAAIGLHGIFLAFLAVTSTFSALSYPYSIVLQRFNKDAIRMVVLSVCIGIITSFLVGVLGFLWGNEILKLLHSEEMITYIFLLPIAMLVNVLNVVLGESLSRNGEFLFSAIHSVLLVAVGILLKVLLAYYNATVLSLIMSFIIGLFVSILVTLFIWKKIKRVDFKELQTASLVSLAIEYKDFPIYRTSQNFINAISQNLPLFLLASFFNVSVAGQYSIAVSLLSIPSAIFGGAVMTVFYPRISVAIRDNEDVRKLITDATWGLIKVSCIPFVLVMLFGPQLFCFVFGEKWDAAGGFAQWLSVWFFFQLINKPAVAAVTALRLQSGLLLYEIISTVTKIFALWLGYRVFEDSLIAVALYSVLGVLAYLWLIFWVINRSSDKSQTC